MSAEIIRVDPPFQVTSHSRGYNIYRTRMHLSEATQDEALIRRLVITNLGEYKQMRTCEIQFPYDCVLVTYALDSGD